MADIRLVRPEAGVNRSMACQPEAKFIFDFPTDAATLSRNGDNLVMSFEDGATLSLTDFYKSYTSKNMPSFEVDGAHVAGADFFTAMNEPDLMPAAGPGGNASPAGGRFHQYSDMALYSGLDRLGGLDVGWTDGGNDPQIEGGAGLLGAGDTIVNDIPSITPTDPNRPGLEPDTPIFPVNPDDPDNPPYPGGNDNPFTGRDVLVVSERGLPNGTDPNAPTTAKGSTHVESRDGVQRLEVGGKTVYENGKFTPQDIPTDEGVLHVTGYNPETGELTYEYELTDPSPEHGRDGADNKFGHDIPVTVTDPEGDRASSTITVVIEDDVPLAQDDENTVSEGKSVKGSVLDNDTPGADGYGDFDGSRVQWNVEGEPQPNGDIVVQTDYGTATLHPDGSYDFTAKEDAGLKPGDSVPLTFDYTITDSDGDTSDAELTITVTGDNNTPGITPEIPDPDDPDPTPDPEDPDNPDPKPDPEDPDNPDPEDPDNPDPKPDPEDPDNPDPKPDPDDPKASVPSGIPGMIYVDEGTNPESSETNDSVDANHGPHGQSGKGSFNVQLNGEKGTITLTDDHGNSATLTVDENGNYTLQGDTTFRINGVDVTLENDGHLAKNSDGSWKVDYSYKLSGPQAHTDNDTTISGEEISITVTDQSGDTATGKLASEVHDDVPVLNSLIVKNTDVDKADGAQIADSDSHINVTLDGPNFGADAGPGAQITVTVTDEAGNQLASSTWTKDANGNWTSEDGNSSDLFYNFAENRFSYHRPDGDIQKMDGVQDESDTYKFNVELKDSDGDIVSRDVTVSTLTTPEWIPDPDNPTPDPDPEDPKPDPENPDPENPHAPGSHLSSVTTDDSYLAGGTKEGSKDDDGGKANSNTAEGHFGITLNGDEYSITIEAENGEKVTLKLDANGDWSGDPLTVKGVYGDLTITGVKAGQITYEYTQNKAYDHAHKEGEANLPDEAAVAEQFNVQLQDQHEHTLNGHIDVSIEDDAPVLNSLIVKNTDLDRADGAQIADDDSHINVTLDGANFGADAGPGAQITVTVTDEAGNQLASSTWTKDANGNWTSEDGNSPDLFYNFAENRFIYHRPDGDIQKMDGVQDESDTYKFNVELKDSDGDTVAREVTVTTLTTPEWIPDPDNPTPDPDPEDPKPDPDPEKPDPENPAVPGMHLSSVTTDESYLQNADGDLTGTGSAPADGNDNLASGNTAEGHFGVTLNGDEYSITIEAENGEKVTLNLDAEGNWSGELVLHGLYGDLTITGVKAGQITYEYTQNKAYDHAHKEGEANLPDEAAVAEQFKVQLQDQHEHTLNGHIDVNIEDDAPVLNSLAVTNTDVDRADGAQIADDDSHINVTLDGANFGADAGPGAQITVTVTDEAGNQLASSTWTKDANGNWTSEDGNSADLFYNFAENRFSYHRPDDDIQKMDGVQDESDTYKFNVELKDSDGDTVAREVTVTTVTQPEWTPDPEAPEPDPDNPNTPGMHLSSVVTDDSYVPGGTREGSKDRDGGKANSNTAEGQFDVTLNGDEYSITIEGADGQNVTLKLDAEGNWSGDPLTVHGVYGDLTITGVKAGQITYEYTQNKAYDHAHKEGEDNLPDEKAFAEQFRVQLQDQHEHTLNGHIDVSIEDDAPTLSVNDITDTVSVDMGADSDGVYNGTGDAKVEVFENESNDVLQWEKSDGGFSSDLTEMRDGEVWKTNDFEVRRYGDNYEFSNKNENSGKDLTVKATDADGDFVNGRLHLEPSHTDITVGTPTTDTWQPGYPDPGDPNNPFNPEDNGHNDFVIGDIFAQGNGGESCGNFAFLLDTSSSLDAGNLSTAIDAVVTAIQSIINALKGTSEHAEVLLAEFNLVPRHAITFEVNGDTDLNALFGGKGLKQFLEDSFEIGGKFVGNHSEDPIANAYNNNVGGGPGSIWGATNYESALDLAKEWFKSLGNNAGTNKTFLITDGEPTAYVEDAAWKGKILTFTNSGTSWGSGGLTCSESDWTPGEGGSFEWNGHTVYVDGAGVLYQDAAYQEPLLADVTARKGGHNQWGAKVPLVLQPAANGGYEAHRVSGMFTNNSYQDDNTQQKRANGDDGLIELWDADRENQVDQAHDALKGTGEVGDVVILGAGDNWNTDGTIKDIADGLAGVETQTGVGFSGIADAIQKSLQDFDPASDILLGGKGNDLIFGDRVDYQNKDQYDENHTNAETVNTDALLAMAIAMGYDGSNESLGELASFISDNAAEFSKQLEALGDGQGGNDILMGGSGHDVLFGQGGNDLLMGDAGDTLNLDALYTALDLQKADGINTLIKAFREKLSTLQTDNALEDFLGKLDSLEDGSAHGDDLLFAGKGDDILLGGAGNDYLNGGDGSDILYGGAGNDLIVYDKDDYAVFGGDGIDILLSNNGEETLAKLLDNAIPGADGNTGGPKVRDVEVFLKGHGSFEGQDFNVEDLTSLSDLARKAGITVNGNTLELGDGWLQQPGNANVFVKDDMTVEIQGFDHMNMTDDGTTQFVFQLTTNQGG